MIGRSSWTVNEPDFYRPLALRSGQVTVNIPMCLDYCTGLYNKPFGVLCYKYLTTCPRLFGYKLRTLASMQHREGRQNRSRFSSVQDCQVRLCIPPERAGVVLLVGGAPPELFKALSAVSPKMSLRVILHTTSSSTRSAAPDGQLI
jgi:hypothetical protein